MLEVQLNAEVEPGSFGAQRMRTIVNHSISLLHRYIF
jgi:hypothetical protein